LVAVLFWEDSMIGVWAENWKRWGVEQEREYDRCRTIKLSCV
jgi:hypothetical protein